LLGCPISGLRSSLTIQSYLSSGCSPLRAMMPEPTRAERTTTTPAAAHLSRRYTRAGRATLTSSPRNRQRNRWFADSLRWRGMDSNVQFRVRSARGSSVRPSWGRSTGAPVIRAVAGLGTPIELSGGGRRSRHSPPGSGSVTPSPRCRRCKRIAEPTVRIRSPPAESRTNVDRGLRIGRY